MKHNLPEHAAAVAAVEMFAVAAVAAAAAAEVVVVVVAAVDVVVAAENEALGAGAWRTPAAGLPHLGAAGGRPAAACGCGGGKGCGGPHWSQFADHLG